MAAACCCLLLPATACLQLVSMNGLDINGCNFTSNFAPGAGGGGGAVRVRSLPPGESPALVIYNSTFMSNYAALQVGGHEGRQGRGRQAHKGRQGGAGRGQGGTWEGGAGQGRGRAGADVHEGRRGRVGEVGARGAMAG